MTAHLYALSDEWALWRWFAVRAAGFPVADVELLAGDSRHGQCEVASDPRFAEAFVWQKPGRLSQRGVEGGRRIGRGKQVAAPRGTDRQLLAALLREERHHRVFSARSAGAGSTSRLPEVTARPGPGLVARRWVRFESWCIEALADETGPRRPHPALDAPPPAARRVGARHTQPAAAEALAACDGQRPARDIAPDHVLADLEAQELIIWRFAIPSSRTRKRPCGRNCSGSANADAPPRGAGGARRPRRRAGPGGRRRRGRGAARRGARRPRGDLHRPSRARSRPAPRDGCTAPASSSTKTAAATSEMTMGPPLLEGLAEALPAILCGSRWFVGAVTDAVNGMLGDAVAAARREPAPGRSRWRRCGPAPFPSSPSGPGVGRPLPRRHPAGHGRGCSSDGPRCWPVTRPRQSCGPGAATAFANALPAGRGAVTIHPTWQVAAPSVEVGQRASTCWVYGDSIRGGCIMKQASGDGPPDFDDLLAGYGRDFPARPALFAASRPSRCPDQRGAHWRRRSPPGPAALPGTGHRPAPRPIAAAARPWPAGMPSGKGASHAWVPKVRRGRARDHTAASGSGPGPASRRAAATAFAQHSVDRVGHRPTNQREPQRMAGSASARPSSSGGPMVISRSRRQSS